MPSTSIRHLRVFARQPYYLGATLSQPIIWLLLFGQLFKGVTRLPGFEQDSYIAYLTPGIVVMTAVFINGWSGTNYIVDMERGVLNRFLVTPASRGALLAGELGYMASTTVLQSGIILGLGFALGARFHGGPAIVLVFVLASVLLGLAFSALSNAMALLVRNQQSLIAANTLLVLPLSFMSTAFLPAGLLPEWMRVVAHGNPFNWAVEVGSQALVPDVDWTLALTRLAWLALLAAGAAWASIRAFAIYQRSA